MCLIKYAYFVLEPKGSVQPRITVEKHVTKQVKVGDDIILPCVAQGFPVPQYRQVHIYFLKKLIFHSYNSCLKILIQLIYFL